MPNEQSDEFMTETEYLSREVEEAREALKRSVADLQSNAKASLDLSAWARAYPLPAVGAAAIAGFALAATLGSRSKPASKPGSDPSDAQGTPSSAGSPAAFAWMSPALFDLAKLLIETVIMSGIRSAQAAPDRSKANPD
jgi:hypothetical protein